MSLTAEKEQTALVTLVHALRQSKFTVVLTGAGISTASGIADLAHMPGIAGTMLSSEQALVAAPNAYYRQWQKTFLHGMFDVGPTIAHREVSRLEQQGLVQAVVTTNVDYLHELAGSRQVADIWNSFNVNTCLKCGRVYPISVWRAGQAPHCPECGGLLSPAPAHNHVGRDLVAVRRANQWMDQADLVIVTGSNGYYDDINAHAQVIQINPQSTVFDHRANLNIRTTADEIFGKVGKMIDNN